MNIFVLSHRIPYPANKGEKIRTFHQIEFLASKGHNISVLSPKDSEQDDDYAKVLTDLFCETAKCFPKPSFLNAALKALFTNQAVSVTTFYSQSLQEHLDNALKEGIVDLILCTSSSMAEYVFRSKSLSKLSTKRPILLMDFMDLDSDKWSQYEEMKRFPANLIYKRESKLLGSYERDIHSFFDACLFISMNEIQLFLQSARDEGKLHEIGNGIDTETFTPSLNPKPQKGPILLFTGVMDYLPNEDAVCWFVEEAWSSVKERHPNAEFYIAGMSPSQKVEALKQHDGVHVTGFVDDIKQYFDKSHIFIAPFRLARGVQNKVLQAFACGLPTITSSSGCEGISANHNEHVLIANDMTEIIDSIDKLTYDQELANSISSQCAKLIRDEFSWESKLDGLANIIEELKEKQFTQS